MVVGALHPLHLTYSRCRSILWEKNRRRAVMKQWVERDETSSRWRPRVTAHVIKHMYTLTVMLLLLTGRIYSGPAKSIPTTSKAWFLKHLTAGKGAIGCWIHGPKDDDKEHILLVGFFLLFVLEGSRQLVVSPSEFGSLLRVVIGDGRPR